MIPTGSHGRRATRPRALLAALACGVLAHCVFTRAAVAQDETAATAQSYLLQLDLQPGVPTLWRSLREVEEPGHAEGSWLELVYEEQVIAAESQEEGAERRARVATRVLRARWSAMQGDERLLLDTAIPPEGGAPLAAAGEWALLAGTAGSTLVARLDSRGQADELTGMEELRARVRQQIPGDAPELTWHQLSARLREDALLARISEHMSWLPSGEVTVGETWTRKTQQVLLGGMLELDRELEYTLVAAEQVAGSVWLKISIAGEITGTSQLPDVTYESGTCTGTMQFDVTAGRLVELHLTTTTEMSQAGKKQVTTIAEHLVRATPEDLATERPKQK